MGDAYVQGRWVVLTRRLSPPHSRFGGPRPVHPRPLPPLAMIDAPHEDPALHARIEETLDTIRPYLMADGGSVRLSGVTPDMVAELELLGACGSCPMSMMTLRAGIEQAVRRAVPEVVRVEAVAPGAPAESAA